MTPPKAFQSLLTGKAPFCRWQGGSPLRVDFFVAGHADCRARLSKSFPRGEDGGFALLFCERVGKVIGCIAERQSGRPSHFDRPSFSVWPPI